MRFKFLFLVLLLMGKIEAVNLGVWGATFPIIERDLLELIHYRLQETNIDQINDELIKNIEKHIYEPYPVLDLKTTCKDRVFYYDPTFILQRDIYDHRDNLLVKKGAVVNPLDIVSFNKRLFFIDATDPEQMAYLLEEIQKYEDNSFKIILTKGNIKRVQERLNNRIYFDQYGRLVNKLKIRYLPSVVSQQGNRLEIKGIALDEC